MDSLPCQDEFFPVGCDLIFNEGSQQFEAKTDPFETDMLPTELTTHLHRDPFNFCLDKKPLAFIKKYLVFVNLKFDYLYHF